MKSTSRRLASLILTVVTQAAISTSARAVQDQAPKGIAKLRIETFTASRAYAVGTTPITLIATVRNVGDAALADGAIAGRLICVNGLEYGEGDTLPKLPPLAPNALMTYRWRVTPINETDPLVAAFSLEYPGRSPDVRVLAIQHLPSEPLEGVPSVLPAPVARVTAGRAVLENGRVRARIELTGSSVPGLWLSARGAGGWRKAGVNLPLAETLSGEGGQQPWWEVFRSEDLRAVNGIGEASLVVTGGIGIRWRATMTFTLRASSSVIDYDIRLSPLRPIKISGLRLGTLHAGDGGFGANVTEEIGYTANGTNAIVAVRSADLTVGCAWPTQPLFKEWRIQPVASAAGADYQTIGIEHLATSGPVDLQAGALVDYHCRMYAICPSLSAKDAFNIFVPAQRTVAKPAPPPAKRMASRTSSKRISASRRSSSTRRASDRRKASKVQRGKRSGRKSTVSATRSRRSSAASGVRSKSKRTSITSSKRTAGKRRR